MLSKAYKSFFICCCIECILDVACFSKLFKYLIVRYMQDVQEMIALNLRRIEVGC